MQHAKTTKEQKVAIPDVFNSIQDCARAIEAALEAMDPPIGDDIHTGVLQLIAEFALPHGEWEPDRPHVGHRERVCKCYAAVRFGLGGVDFFDISDDGMTATRNAKNGYSYRIICAVPSFSDGKHASQTSVIVANTKKSPALSRTQRDVKPKLHLCN